MAKSQQSQWERSLDRFESHSNNAVYTKDFSFMYNLAALSIVAREDHRADLATRPGTSEYASFLDGLNIDVCVTIENAMRSCSSIIEQNMDKDFSSEEWEALILKHEHESITSARDKILHTNGEARALIATFPSGVQAKASMIFIDGATIAMPLFTTLCSQLEVVYSSASEYVKGDFESVTSAQHAVSGTVKAAIATIEKLAVPRSTASSTSQSPKGGKQSMAKNSFVGTLNWHADVNFAAAVESLSEVTTYLVDNADINITAQGINRGFGDDKADQTLYSRTYFEWKTEDEHPTTLKALWTAAVDDLEGEGHYIPPLTSLPAARYKEMTSREGRATK